MHILVINFSLDGISHEEYCKVADELAPIFAQVAGLESKTWLSDQENNVYGGVYVFKNKQALEDYCAGELFAGVGSNPNFTNISVKSFGTHGYDPDYKSMNGIFIARGPGFNSGFLGPEVHNIHLYEMMCHLMGVTPAINDGDITITAPFLK